MTTLAFSRALCSAVKPDLSQIFKQSQRIQLSWKTRCTSCRGLYCSLKSISRVTSFPLTNIHRLHYQALSSDNRKPTGVSGSGVNRSDLLDKILEDRKKQLVETQQQLRQTQLRLRLARLKLKESRLRIMQDIQDTRSMMKERMEEVIERENIWTIPNILCVTRILSSPYLGYLIIQSDFNMALGFLVVAGVSDALDGWIARTWKSQSSKLGSFLDPMADKVLVATLFLSLTYVNLIPVYLTALIVVRDVSLVTAAMVVRYRSLPPPRTMSRYFDATHATVQLAPTTISKVNTMVQLCMVATTLAAPVFGFVNHQALQALWYVTAGTTVASAASYIFSKDTYKYLKKKKR